MCAAKNVFHRYQGICNCLIWMVLAFSLVGCSGEISSTTTTGSSNQGWVTIESPTNGDSIIVDNQYTITVSGSAFISPDYYYCTTTYCDPAVTVVVHNLTTGATINAASTPEYCWFLGWHMCGHHWGASVPLVLGDNQIQVEAYDQGGNYGTDTLSITLVDTIASSVTTSSPANGESNVALDTTVQVNFSEPVQTSSITASRVYLTDDVGSVVPATLIAQPNMAQLVPDQPLQYTRSYTIHVDPGLVDTAGNISTQTYVATFTTSNRQWATPVSVYSSRRNHTSVYTGDKIILWGGYYGQPESTTNKGTQDTGTVFDPVTQASYATSTTNAPLSRALHSSVWTGSEMIIWGGRHGIYSGVYVESIENSGGRYDPLTNSWQATSLTNAPAARYGHSAVWTGTEMIIWGGTDVNGNRINSGARYNPVTDTWTAISAINAPTARTEHSAVWTGTEMIIWGGRDSSGPVNTGARYNPVTDSWTTMSTAGAVAPRGNHTAVWSGTQMLVWGKSQYTSTYTSAGGRYDPLTDSWSAMATTASPVGREQHTAVWNGNAMIIWGGFRLDSLYDPSSGFNRISKQYLNDVTLYYPDASDGYWVTIPADNAPPGRYAHTANMAGSTLVICNGNEDATPDDSFANNGLITGSCVSLPGL